MLQTYIAFYAYIFIAKVIKKVKIIFNADIYDTLYSKMYFISVRNIYMYYASTRVRVCCVRVCV